LKAKSRGPEEEIQLTALRWIDSFFDICPEDILPFVPRLLAQVLPAMASSVEQVREAANGVNNSLLDYIVSLSDEATIPEVSATAPSRIPTVSGKDQANIERRDFTNTARPSLPASRDVDIKRGSDVQTPPPRYASPISLTAPLKQAMDLDYTAAVEALTMQFLNEHEETRVAALSWLLMLHRKAPKKVLAINDGTFPALLKTLSDPADAVVTRDLQLLSQISRNSEDDYFTSFMVNLLQLFCTDRKLLETRGNLIIRQLCVSLSAERIYRTLADCLEKDEVQRVHLC
jgi:vacuole morphology and inheritance protein 14